MKNLYCILLACLVPGLAAIAQKKLPPIRLKTGVLTKAGDLQAAPLSKTSKQRMQFGKKNYLLLRFNQVLSAPLRRQLQEQGISIFDYIPGNAFFAELPDQPDLAGLKKFGVNGIFLPDPSAKISGRLSRQPVHPTNNNDKVIAVNYFGSISRSAVTSELIKAGAQIAAVKIQPDHIIFVQANASVVQKIAALPFITYVDIQPLKDIPVNYNNRSSASVQTLNYSPGRNLQGKNVTVGVGDNADPTHIDFSGRLINRTPLAPAGHGTHTTGTTGGAGIVNPRNKGMAPKATLISQAFSDILVNTPVYRSDFGMILTNNSYHSSDAGCPGTGDYDALSNYVDAQMYNDAALLHVFASGNDGTLSCGIYPPTYGTVRSGFQSGKNGLVVGAINTADNAIALSSSRGPVNDGRIKPEIMAGGLNVISTTTNNNYTTISGTSMACPAVTGSLALLYERYRQLHAGADPAAALIKAAACNGADDMGIPGPDYWFGFGRLNARAAVEIIENNQYFSGSIAHGAVNNHTITGLPAGTSQLKILLYWVDPPASPAAATALINNLDLTATGTDALLHRPLVLNSNPANVSDTAREGTDNLNNIEQVVINVPPAGDVTVSVTGANIPSGPQQYVIVYQVIQPSITVEYPSGGETWVFNEPETIRWNAYDGGTDSFAIEYSRNNGATWAGVDTVHGSLRLCTWIKPDTIATNEALIRVRRMVSGVSGTSPNTFTMLGQPVLTITNPCTGYLQLDWGLVPLATSYEILLLKGDSLQVIGNTNVNIYLLSGLQPAGSYWVAVRALNGVNPGRPSLAKNAVPNSGPCSLAAFDNDLTPEALLVPATGRMFTSSQLGNNNIEVRIKNNGAIATSGSFDLFYQVNGGTIVQEISNHAFTPAGTLTFSFTQPFDFSATGTYEVKVWVKHTSDGQDKNDTLVTTIKHLQNDPVVLNQSYTESFESAAIQTYTSTTKGFDGLDRLDFTTSSTNGRARTFVNTGFARTGNRCITLDQVRNTFPGSSNTDSAVATFNLSNYGPTEQIWLDFYYRNQGIDFVLPGNRVWIRGNENAAWIPVFTLPPDISEAGVYRHASSVNITETLAGVMPAQTISSSFQVKFGQQGYTSANSVVPPANLDDGISYDDIILTRAIDDVHIRSLMSPVTTGICTLTNAENIRVEIKNNSSNTLNNVEVAYELNGTVVTQQVNLTPNQLLLYTFPVPVDLSAFQTYTIRAWIHYTGDNYANNDTLAVRTFTTTPLITTYPYLESFETNNGYWYTGGSNSSWEWGAPGKPVINKAANGANAWVTSLNGSYNNDERSYLYSPCFNLTGMAQPVLSFSHIFQTEDNCDCDNHWVEYSTDDVTWTKVGAVGNGTNWYDYAPRQAWKMSVTRWKVSSINIPVIVSKIRFRIVMLSDQGVTMDGVGIDDVHIFDKAAVYTGPDITSGITQPVSGNSWVHFSAGGNRVVSIHPQGQNLGATTVKMYIHPGPVRNNSHQYYLDRNIVIQSATPPAGNVLVRYYFSNTEANNLVNATGCAGCTRPVDPYEAGVTQYSGSQAAENGTLADNSSGNYQFLRPHMDITIVPYDNGYYAEYAVNHFSEFWINGGGPGQNNALPVTLEQFTVLKKKATALLQWITAQELNSRSFIIEKSSDGIHYAAIGEVPAAGNSNSPLRYQFTDPHLLNGINYYRLQITDIDGQSRLSPVRTLSGNGKDIIVSLYPNPVTNGLLYVTASVECSRIELTDVSGRIIRSVAVRGMQHTLSLHHITKGTYFVRVYTTAGKKIEKIVVGSK